MAAFASDNARTYLIILHVHPLLFRSISQRCSLVFSVVVVTVNPEKEEKKKKQKS